MRSCFLILVALLIISSRTCRAADEFNGPFPSWADVKRDYGAVGDGKADDTAAIQKALDDLREHKKHNVLFFPAGTYRLTQTVQTLRKDHTDCMGVTIVGEDPATTILRWDGPAGGTMLKYDTWYSAIRRLTLDGAGKAATALAYGDAFSTYNETTDMTFQDVETGMQMATGNDGQAENAVLRCRFLRCSNAGLTTVNFNSLDEWVWNCRFEDCGYGLLNGAGNFHAYENLFLRSKIMDIGARNLMVFSFVNNTSVGSRCFMDWQSQFTWGSPCSITGNRIAEPAGDFAIRLGNGGPFLVAYNTIKSRANKMGPEVVMTWADQALVGNTFTVAEPIEAKGRYRMLDQKITARVNVSSAMPTLPETPPHRKRQVFEVLPGADAAAIQRALDDAGKLTGKKPVVHLPVGSYKVDRTLVVPANSDVQIVGDGAAETGTVLEWTGAAGEPLLKLDGPSRTTLRDFSIVSRGGIGILAEKCDQPGGVIYGDQVNATGLSPTQKGDAGILVDGVEQSDVIFHCCQGGTSLASWIKVIGGPLRQAGKPAPGQVSVFCGATGTSDTPYSVEKSGRLLVRSVYHEVSGDAPEALHLADAGSLTIDATRFSYHTTAERPLIALDSFRGDFALITSLLLPVESNHTARVTLAGNGSATNALLLGDLFWQNRFGTTTDLVWLDKSAPKAHAALLLSNMNINAKAETEIEKKANGYGALDNRGEADDAFIRKMLAPIRAARTSPPESVPAGATDLRMHRVIVTAGPNGKGIVLRR